MKITLKGSLLGTGGLLLLAWNVAHAQTTIRMEAEDMMLDTYQVDARDFASNGALINLKGPGTNGSATATFIGATGEYDISVVYHDESDGLSQLSLSINGEILDSWMLEMKGYNAQAQIVNRRTRLIGTGIAVTSGDEIRIEGVQHNWDHANVDYIELMVAGQSGSATLPTEIAGFYSARQVRIQVQPGEPGSATSWCDDGDIAISGGLFTESSILTNGTNSPDFNFRLTSFLKIRDGQSGIEGWSVGGVNESPAPIVAVIGVNAICADRDF